MEKIFLFVSVVFGIITLTCCNQRNATSNKVVSPDLIAPSEDYDSIFAHKPWVIKWNGVAYHFYNAVGNSGRVIALATSKNLTK